MNAQQLPYLLALNSIDKLSPRRLRQMLDDYGLDAEALWRDGPDWPGLGSRIRQPGREAIAAAYGRLEPERLYSRFLETGCSALAWGDEDYPPLLAAIYDPPPLLMYHGRLPRAQEICVAIIGSRRHTAYGRQVAEIFARDLAAAGFTIVSGLARGIDSIGHRSALKAGGRTVGLLGCGLDVYYPRENQELYGEIAAQGAVISEFPLGAPADPRHFPRRNRIISGLSRGVLVVEAGEKSGTMLTVDYALEQGRDVFAVPGPITSPESRGANRLIKEGRNIMALSPEDIRSQYQPGPPPALGHKEPEAEAEEISATEKKLLDALILPVQMDDIVAEADVDLTPAQLAALLTMLEIRGLVRQLPGKYYQTVVRNIK